jgi:hypothetical protein
VPAYPSPGYDLYGPPSPPSPYGDPGSRAGGWSLPGLPY